MTAIQEVQLSEVRIPEVQDGIAPPVCLCPWLENPYRLVSLWDMLSFDAGRLVRSMQFLAETTRILEGPGFNQGLFADLINPKFYLNSIRDVVEYCGEMPFPMTEVPLKRILRLANGSQPFTVKAMAELLGEAARRLRDEAGIYTLLRVSAERSRFYSEPRANWEDVIKRFPNTVSDIEEANICFSLERYPACVFHSVQVIETGLIALGSFLGVKDPKSGWTATANELERIVKKRYADLTPFESQYIGLLKQIQATVVALQDAWRNKISHAQGRLSVMTADFSPHVAEEILMATRGFMRRLATDLP
jgi:HEPN domain-containing protein